MCEPLFWVLFRALLGQQFDLQHFRAIAGAVTIRAANIHIAEKLHFDVLEAAAAAGWAAALGRVKAESSGAVAALLCQRLFGTQRPDRIEGAHIADRIRAGGFTYRALIDQYNIIDMFVSMDGLMPAGLFYGALLKFAHRHVEHVLN